MRVTTGNAPGCAEGRTGCVQGVRVLPGCERTRPVPSTRTRPEGGEGVNTPRYDGGSDRPCPEAEPYCGTRRYRTDCVPHCLDGVGGSLIGGRVTKPP